MDKILQSLKCISPCIVPALSLVGFVMTLNWVKSRMIYRGPMPSSGPVEGFDSKEARVKYFSTTEQRFKEMIKVVIIWIIIAGVGELIYWLITNYRIINK